MNMRKSRQERQTRGSHAAIRTCFLRKTTSTALLSILLCYFPHETYASAHSNGRPPMSLTAIVNDLEAEGGISKGFYSCTLLSSRSFPSSSTSELLQRLATCSVTADSDEERQALLEEVEPDVSSVGLVRNGIGLSFSSASSASEASLTVRACGGKASSLVYVASPTDLRRGEGLFDTLAPALEAMLKSEDKGGMSTLVVVLPCHVDETEKMDSLQSKFETAASAMLTNLVPSSSKTPLTFQNVVDRVVYLPQDVLNQGSLDDLFDALCPSDLQDELSFRDPSDIIAAVGEAVPFSLDALFLPASGTSNLSPTEVAAARVLLSARTTAVQEGLTLVTTQTKPGNTQLVSNFGELCDAALRQAVQTYHDLATASSLAPATTTLFGQFKEDLTEELASALEGLYEGQLELLQQASFEKFKQGMSSLRVSPNLASDMGEVRKEHVALLDRAVAKLASCSSSGGVLASFASLGQGIKTQFRQMTKEFCTDRLAAARVSGAYRPMPRKAVTVGLHWLLPQPFGSDYRQAAEEGEMVRNFVYHPPTGRVEVDGEEVKRGTGEWKSKIVPSPAGSDLVYSKGL